MAKDFKEKLAEKNLGQKTNRLFALKGKKTDINSELKELNKEIDSLQWEIINDMQDIGVDKLSTEMGTVSKTISLYPSLEDKEEFIQWAVDNDRVPMIVAKANEAVFREYFNEFNEYPPGTDAYEKSKLNMRRK